MREAEPDMVPYVLGQVADVAWLDDNVAPEMARADRIHQPHQQRAHQHPCEEEVDHAARRQIAI